MCIEENEKYFLEILEKKELKGGASIQIDRPHILFSDLPSLIKYLHVNASFILEYKIYVAKEWEEGRLSHSSMEIRNPSIISD